MLDLLDNLAQPDDALLCERRAVASPAPLGPIETEGPGTAPGPQHGSSASLVRPSWCGGAGGRAPVLLRAGSLLDTRNNNVVTSTYRTTVNVVGLLGISG